MKLQDLPIKDQIDWLARYVLIHSIAYYDFNYNMITDKQYDDKMKQLEQLINDNKEIALTQCRYRNILKDFTSASGFDLKYKLTDAHREYLEHLTQNIINLTRCNY